MFLIFFYIIVWRGIRIYILINIIKYFFGFIENNSVFMGFAASLIVSSFWMKNYIKQKRAEAFFGFYARLLLRIKSLRAGLYEKGQLNVVEPKKGNIFSLIYTEDYIKEVCPQYRSLEEIELHIYKSTAMEIKKILIEADNNVYPPGSNRKEWYDSQFILFSFCEFLENSDYQAVTNEKYEKGTKEYKHILRCKNLIRAMNYIQYSIENARY